MKHLRFRKKNKNFENTITSSLLVWNTKEGRSTGDCNGSSDMTFIEAEAAVFWAQGPCNKIDKKKRVERIRFGNMKKSAKTYIMANPVWEKRTLVNCFPIPLMAGGK